MQTLQILNLIRRHNGYKLSLCIKSYTNKKFDVFIIIKLIITKYIKQIERLEEISVYVFWRQGH